jgi:O-antigen/teichoic acid export membrane protein
MSWSVIGNIVEVGCSWAFITLLVKLGTTTMVGQYGLVLALLSPIFSLTNMQMRALQASDARQEFSFGVYFITRVLTTLVALVALAAVLVVNREDRFIVFLSLVTFARFAVLAVQDTYVGLLQQQEQIDRMAQVQMLASFALVGAFTVGLVTTDSLIVGIGSSTIAVVVATIFFSVPAAKRLTRERPIRNGLALEWDRRAIRELLVLASPLGVISFLLALQHSLPRLFLNQYDDESQLGVFVALTAISTAGITLMASVSQAVVPRMAWLRKDGDRRGFIRLLVQVELVSFVVLVASVIGAWLIGPIVVRNLYTPEYAEFRAALMWLAAACGLTLMSRYLGNAITVARRLTAQMSNKVLVIGLMLGLCQLLVPAYGITGAAASIALAEGISLVLNLVVCIRFLNNWVSITTESGDSGLE